MKKIDKLTEDQIAKFPDYVNKWTDIGLSTEPVNLEEAKNAVCKAYSLVGLKEPTQFYVADSPMDAIRIIQSLDSTKPKNDIFNEMIYGNQEAYWLGFFDFFGTEFNMKECKILDGLNDLAKHCGWLNVYEDVVVFQHRPSHIHFDEQNRLHNANGAAIEFRDGFGVYAWHGLRIPREWIMNKESLTPKIALTWQNIEQRRVACEILGWAKILTQLESKLIDADDDPEIGVLVEVNIPDIGKEKFLRVLCGTKREFALPVPPDMKTAVEAQAWTYGFSLNEFLKPEIRT